MPTIGAIEKSKEFSVLGGTTLDFWTILGMNINPATEKIQVAIAGYKNESAFTSGAQVVASTVQTEDFDFITLGITAKTTVEDIQTNLFSELLAKPFFLGGTFTTVSF